MKCKLSIDINQNKNDDLKNLVTKNGAVAVTMIQSMTTDKNFNTKVALPSNPNFKLRELDATIKAHSYKFSGTKYTSNGFADAALRLGSRAKSRIDIMATPEAIAQAESFFNRKNKKISPTRGNVNRVIVEGSIESILDSDTRSFVRLTEEDKKTIWNRVQRENKGKPSQDSKNLLGYRQALEALIVSGLYRGYDILLDAPLHSDVIQNAITTYNSGLNNNNSKVFHASEFSGREAVTINNIDSFIAGLDNEIKVEQPTKVYKGIGLLDTFLSDRERTAFNDFKKASNASKRYVVDALTSVFQKYMPGATTQVLTSYEIDQQYGNIFADKKGFITGNSIILNIDKLDSTTAFHEFGHYYMSWLKQHNKREYDRLLSFTEEKYSDKFNSFTNTYNNTGLKFSSEEILEEIFVEELGMVGAKEINNILDIKETTAGTLVKGSEESIEVFMDRFMRGLIRSKKVSRKDVGFDLYTSIADLIDISATLDVNPGSLFGSMDVDSIKSMKEFFIEASNPEDVFEGLITRGLITRVGEDRIKLTDERGNRVDKDGNIAHGNLTYRYKQPEYNAVKKEYRHKWKVVEELTGFLDKFKAHADVRFAVNSAMQTTESKILANNNNVYLDKVKNKYINKAGLEHDRTTEYNQINFTSNYDKENYISIEMFYRAKRKYITTRPNDDPLLREKEAIEYAKELMGNENSAAYKAGYKEVAELFEFKTEEGTYLHNISELFVRALNYSNKIDYGKEIEGGYTYFMSHIHDAITNLDRDKFAIYFDKFFFSRLNGQKDTKEYEDFLAAYTFVNENMDSKSAIHADRLLVHLTQTLRTHVFKALKGPLILMPEVRLNSASLKIAGTIDLLVIDGDGKAHIFDYKTKEQGKRKNWDFNSPVKMTEEMSGYSENAMMKASMQTSVYKLILLEMGIEVGPANVFYIESKIHGGGDNAFSERNRMRYSPTSITKESLIDVTSDLVKHFGKTRELPDVFMAENDATDIMKVIVKASAGTNIDMLADVDKTAKNLYHRAMTQKHNSSNPEVRKVMEILKLNNTKKGGLVIRMYGGSEHSIDPKYTKEEDIVEQIKELIVNRHDVKALEARLEQQFYNPNQVGRSKKDQVIASLLAGASSATHEFIKMSSRINLGVDFSGFVMLKDKITNEYRLLILNHDIETSLPFGQNHHNIFGNYVTNNIAAAKYPTIKWRNTNYHMRLVKAGLMMARLKQQDPDFKVSMVMTHDSFREGKIVPNLVDTAAILYVSKEMLKLMEKADPGTLPTAMQEMLVDDKLFEAKTYIPNPIDALGEFLSAALMNPFDQTDIFKGPQDSKGIARAKLVKTAIDNLNGRQDYEELLASLHDFKISLERRLPTLEEKVADPLWAATDNVIMHIHSFNYTLIPFNTTMIQNYLFTTSKAANTYTASLNRKTQKYQGNVNQDYNKYKLEHNKLIDELAADVGVNISILGGESVVRKSMKHIFNNLWLDPTNSDRKTAFLLKPPNHSSLSAVESRYLRYVKDTFQKMADVSSFNKINIPDGWVPLMPRSRAGDPINDISLERAYDKLKMFQLNANFHSKDEDSLDSHFSVENRFKTQFPRKNDTQDVGFTDARRMIMGVDENGDLLPNAKDRPLGKIEDNLENIMDVMVIASLDAHHYRDATAFGRSLFYNVKRMEKVSGLTYDKLIETLVLIQKRVINHQESAQSNKALKTLNKFTTNAAIAGTINQFLLEAFTNPMVTGANYLGDKLYGVMFGGTREFSFKSYAAAFSIVSNVFHADHQLVLELDKLYGITSSDTRALKDLLNKLEKNSLWQTKHLMYLNKSMMELWQKITLTAYMIEEGSFYAHSLDAEGNLQYDESKDKRFFDHGVSKDDQLRKKKAYETVREELAQHRNGLTGEPTDPIETRKLNKAWTTYESNYVKELIVELYSSMDETSKSLAMYYTEMSFLAKMRSWIFAKLPRYFQKPMRPDQNESAARLQRVNDPDAEGGYRLEYKGVGTEGILFTLQSMSRQFAEYKLQVFKKGTLEPYQKKNLSKLMGDLIVFSIMSAAANGIFALFGDDDDDKSAMAKLVHQRWIMATGDVFLMKSLLDMTTGNSSMFISVSVGMRMVNAIINAAVVSGQAVIDPETTVDDALKATNNVLRNSAGIYRTLEIGYDAATENVD